MNAREIAAAKPGDVLWDDQVRGLHVRVFEGKRVYYLKYRISGRQRRRRLGNVGALSLAAARDVARGKLASVVRGEDPHAVAQRQRTVKDLYAHWLEVHAPKLASASQVEYKRIFKKHLLPAFKDKGVDSVGEAEVRQLAHELRSKPVQANRCLAVLRAAFNLAEDWGWKPRHTNPVHVKFNREEPRRRYPDEKEAPRLIRHLELTDDIYFRSYIWLLSLTGGRPGEWRKARWDYITEAGLDLPHAKHRRTGRVVTLSAAARNILRRIPKIKDNPYIFPGRIEGTHVVSVKKAWADLLNRAGITGLHMRDLRRYFASIALSDDRVTLSQVGQMLGHRQEQTTRAYAYLMTKTRDRIAEATATHLVGIRDQRRRPSSKSRSRNRRP